MVNYQVLAVSIEHKLCNIFGCERFGFGGIANSDEIRSNPYLCMVVGLMYNYKDKSKSKQDDIQKFFENYSYYSKKTIDELYVENKEDWDKMNEDFSKLI